MMRASRKPRTCCATSLRRQDFQQRLKCTQARCTDGARPIRPSIMKRKQRERGAACSRCSKPPSHRKPLRRIRIERDQHHLWDGNGRTDRSVWTAMPKVTAAVSRSGGGSSRAWVTYRQTKSVSYIQKPWRRNKRFRTSNLSPPCRRCPNMPSPG